MNYRILLPLNYNTTYAEGYPMIVLLHGAGERGNCWFNNCYHATPFYNPVTNSPAAPKTATHRLLNNDFNVNIGGKQHLDARNLAGTRLPNDPTMPARAFPGFVLIPQSLNGSDSLNVQDVIRIILLHMAKYKIDPNRVYIHGLSIGGYGTYEALKRASWLFAAALPMSAVRDASIFKQNQQAKVAHIPIWTFQGGMDVDPSPAFTNQVVNNLRKAGAVVRYTTYPTLAHVVWNAAYGEKEFFTWMLSKNKSNIHPSAGNTVIIRSKNQYPKLMLAEGFFAYQWEKDGVIISTAKSNIYTVTAPGKYRARFSRVSYAPTATQWNKWSATLVITEGTATVAAASVDSAEVVQDDLVSENVFSASVFPNPTTPDNLNVIINTSVNAPIHIGIIDYLGRTVFERSVEAGELQEEFNLSVSPSLTDGIYIVVVNQGRRKLKERLIIRK
jgi:predicted esterase